MSIEQLERLFIVVLSVAIRESSTSRHMDDVRSILFHCALELDGILFQLITDYSCEQTLAITAANLALSLGIFRFLKERYHESRNIILPILRRGALATNDQGNYPEHPPVFSRRSNSYIALHGMFNSKMTDSSISQGAPADLSSDICRASSCGVLVERGTHSKSMV